LAHILHETHSRYARCRTDTSSREVDTFFMALQPAPRVDYRPAPCPDCLALIDASATVPEHANLGRPRPEVGYALYRCTVCHARLSRGPSGWANETI
jgi:hypothetical protein